MKLEIIMKTSFMISILSTIIGAYLKIKHLEGVEILFIVGVIAIVIFIYFKNLQFTFQHNYAE
jgi:hypothetical protein